MQWSEPRALSDWLSTIILTCPRYKCTTLPYKRNNPVCGCTCKRWCWNNGFVQNHLTAGVWTHSPAAQQCWESTRKISGCRVPLPLMSGYLIQEARVSSWTQMVWGGMELTDHCSQFLTYVEHSAEVRECAALLRCQHYKAAPLNLQTVKVRGVKPILTTGSVSPCCYT